MADVDEAMKRALSFLNTKKKNIVLKTEQDIAIRELLNGNDVLAVLPTGFGKSLIFTLYALSARELGKPSTVVVISPLKSIIKDQISDLEGICTAAELNQENLKEILRKPPTIIYASAEQILDDRFLASVKDFDSNIHKSIAALVVDESHTIETWTGKRKSQSKHSKVKEAFREAYGKLSILRSMCREGVPMLALTGTADASTQKTIRAELLLGDTTKELFVSPNRTNLRFDKNKVKRDEMMIQLHWLIEKVKEEGVSSPKTIIFCNTLADIARLMNWLMMQLGSAAFHPKESKKQEHCLVGIYHSMTLEQNKNVITSSLKGNGHKRIVIATTALSMGVNFPDIRHVVMFGPPRSILDFHQEAGRAGRDGVLSDVTIYYYGQQLAHCEDEMRTFLNAPGCIRVSAYASLDNTILPLQPLHDCCNVCSSACDCNSECCKDDTVADNNPCQGDTVRSRVVREEEKELLLNAFEEIKGQLDAENQSIVPFGHTHGFSNELIADIIESSTELFSLEDILKRVPVFSVQHAVKILEVLSEVFDDCDEISEGAIGQVRYPLDGGMNLLGSDYEEEVLEFLELDYL